MAFENPDGSKVVVVLNAGRASTAFKIRWDGQSIVFTPPAKSAATFEW